MALVDQFIELLKTPVERMLETSFQQVITSEQLAAFKDEALSQGRQDLCSTIDEQVASWNQTATEYNEKLRENTSLRIIIGAMQIDRDLKNRTHEQADS